MQLNPVNRIVWKTFPRHRFHPGKRGPGPSGTVWLITQGKLTKFTIFQTNFKNTKNGTKVTKHIQNTNFCKYTSTNIDSILLVSQFLCNLVIFFKKFKGSKFVH